MFYLGHWITVLRLKQQIELSIFRFFSNKLKCNGKHIQINEVKVFC